jgi:hypothetical protein
MAANWNRSGHLGEEIAEVGEIEGQHNYSPLKEK